MKVCDLIGPALDWAVAICEGFVQTGDEPWERGDEPFAFSTDWCQGGPIIEREVITLIHPRWDGWTAHKYNDRVEDESYTVDGPTPLIAAMRCYVASKLGDEIHIPAELL